ncbi:hypothetical protein A2774_00020 [Candidatus Roizmanbacteria bacterium RIFCSPHIGHO2_01_FULL_39_12c]|uniref:SWIM-type domain-containing protein n=1 Tax=Candidatus Roizmanbacteria bacterium RIFCSPHIGHO2_01_FULL_39_12c TaxID=1802031 RepID=A0A1F7GCT9_9BACT|nr:MAG: hypothetical protein A2774_00020 [Candidatus Roizmanbacteria bacterium RIFCSPHIGHO2_01_FULL_39_12c]
MNPPDFTLDKIKFATDEPTFEKAVKLYESGKVTDVKDGIRSYAAIVQGTQPYRVSVEARRYDYGHCTCYLGQKGVLCKHMVALALYVVKDSKPLTDEDKKLHNSPLCSGKLGMLTGVELTLTKKNITSAMRYIKPYNGPSRIWFAYQNSLTEGCNRLSAVISRLPVSEQTADILVDLLFRLDRKLSTGGVDDSDGTVGGFIEEAVHVLEKFARLDSKCMRSFIKLKDRETSFGWEEPLLKIANQN